MPASDDELRAWLTLVLTPGVGAESLRRLLAAFGSPHAVLAASASAWREVAGSACAQALSAPRAQAEQSAQRCLAWRAEAPEQRHLITLADPEYPAALLHSADPPALLYALGDLLLLHQPAVAIVGSRDATPQGLDHARQFAAHLSKTGVTVVSGMALGIDGAAHEGALQGAGSTIAVVGTGLDLVYPRRHLALARRIADEGLMLSEFSLGTPSLAANFPRRNRIIAGLASGTLVVEANLRSGSLITARLALENGRELFAIPGSIQSPQSRGCHQLIREGAMLVEAPEEIVEALKSTEPRLTKAPADQPTAEPATADLLLLPSAEQGQDPLLSAMGHEPITLDSLSARTGWPTDQLLARLLELELDGHLARLPGGLMQRRALA